MSMISYCIRVRFTKDLRLVTTDGRVHNLIQFTSAKNALEFIIKNDLHEKSYPHPMFEHNDWYDYKSVPLKVLQLSILKPEYHVWSMQCI